LQPHVEDARYKISDREWFDPVLAHFLNDIVTINYYGIEEIYDLAMLQKVPVNQHILGEDLDLLNWHEGEDRSVPYDPEKQWGVGVNFDRSDQARFILLDAYRRFPEKFVVTLRERLLNSKEKISGKELVKQVITEVSGMPADVYIDRVSKIQKAELMKHKYQL
jgi:hypothetical protein